MYNEDYETIQKRKAFFLAHRKQFLIGAIVLVVLAIAVVVAYFVYLKIYNGMVKIVVAPSDSLIMIGDKKYKNGERRIKPGDYDVKITREGFVEYNTSISVEPNGTAELYVCMDNNDGVDWNKQSEEYSKLCEQIYGHILTEEMKEKYADPIFSITPFFSYDKGFEVTADPNTEGGKITIHINALSCKPARIEGLNQNALEWLRKAQINPDDYIIDFVNKGCDKIGQ